MEATMAEYDTVEWYEGMLVKARRAGDRRQEASVLVCLGNKVPSRAIEYHTQALEIYQQMGDEDGMCSAYRNLGAAYNVLHNDPYPALDMYRSSLALTEDPIIRKELLQRIERIERDIS
jgi:hypothetical protein